MEHSAVAGGVESETGEAADFFEMIVDGKKADAVMQGECGDDDIELRAWF